MTRSLVALTATTAMMRGRERARVNTAYVDAIEAAGLMPVVSAPLADPALAGDLLDRVDGLVLTGGEDVDPRHYGALAHPATEPPHGRRDEWELALVQEARRRRIPVLAICRGMQVLNVALGGTLIQDIPTDRPSDIRHAQADARGERVHAVAIEPRSALCAAIGGTAIRINSSHHQALDRIAPGLRAVASAEDGIVEGVESEGDGWWVLAVQWHPEELVRAVEPWDRNLFAAFAGEVRRTAGLGMAPAPRPRLAV